MKSVVLAAVAAIALTACCYRPAPAPCAPMCAPAAPICAPCK